MDSETKQAQDFYANFQMLDFDLNHRERKNDRLRNFLLLLLTQLFLASLFFVY
ncbi:MAG: hypothetical protein AAGF83_03525 [Cyanobacteria bacterium P01_G01_bin.67]